MPDTLTLLQLIETCSCRTTTAAGPIKQPINHSQCDATWYSSLL